MKLLLIAMLAVLCGRTLASSEFHDAWRATGTYATSEAFAVEYDRQTRNVIVVGQAGAPSNTSDAFCAVHDAQQGAMTWTKRITNAERANGVSSNGDAIYVGGVSVGGERPFAVKMNSSDGTILWRYDDPSGTKRTVEKIKISSDKTLVFLVGGEVKGSKAYIETLRCADGKRDSYGLIGLTGPIVDIDVTSNGIIIVTGKQFIARMKSSSLSSIDWSQTLTSDYTIMDVSVRSGSVYVTGIKRAANQDFAFWKSFSLSTGTEIDSYSGLIGTGHNVMTTSGIDGSDGPFLVGEETGSRLFIHKYELKRGGVVRRDFKGSLSLRGGYGSLIETNGRAVALILAGSETNYVLYKKELIDNCTGSPCDVKTSECVDMIDDFWCKCKPGYSGKYCTDDVNECLQNPCKNGAKCTDLIGMFSCACLPGYTGSTCDVNINECRPSPCVHGSCNDLINDYHCVCSPGYEGKNCDSDINECKTANCGQGVCKDELNGYTCQCLAGFMGSHCDVNIDECASNPCNNRGTCVDDVNGYRCVCPKGTSLPNCVDTTDDCATGPCYNGAQCRDRVDSVECKCTKGFTGKFCEAIVDSCSNHPCQNGGTCSNLVSGIYCKCPSGIKGPRCETVLDFCDPSLCQNDAQCVNHPEKEQYECVCSQLYYTGLHCENVDPVAASQIEINENNANPIASAINQITRQPLNSQTVTSVSMTVANLIRFGDLSDEAVDDTFDVVDSVMGTSRDVLDNSQTNSNSSAQLSHVLETFGENVLEKSGRDQIRVSKKNIALKSEVWKKMPDRDLHYTLTGEGDLDLQQDEKFSSSWLALLKIDRRLLNSKPVILNAIGMRDESLFRGKLAEKTKIVSPILSIKMNTDGAKMKEFPVRFSMRHSKLTNSSAFNPRCVWWNYTALEKQGNWSDKGCTSHTPTGARYTNCTCVHTTNFAILVDIDSAMGDTISNDHDDVLSIVSLIGCIASLVCIGLTIFVILCFKMLRDNQAMQILLNLCIALFIGLLFFVIGNESYTHVAFCRASAILVHYFVLSAQMWMLMAAVNFYLNLVKVFGQRSKRLVCKYAIIAWGTPLLFVLPGIITEQVTESSVYIRDNGACWLNGIGWFMGAFLAPILLIVVINWFVFGMVAKAIKNSQSGREDKSTLAYKLKIAIAVAQVLGLTWVFAAFTFLDARVVFSYLFAIFASLQGFFIFLFNVAMNREIRGLLRTASKRGIRHVVGKSKDELEKAYANSEVGSACDSLSPTGDYQFGYVQQPRRSFWARFFSRRPRDATSSTGSSLSTSLPSSSLGQNGERINLSRTGSTSSRKSLISTSSRSKTVKKEKQTIGYPGADDVILVTNTDVFSDLPYAKVNTAFYESKKEHV